MRKSSYSGLGEKAIKEGTITQEEALTVLRAAPQAVFQVFSEADMVRSHFFGNRIRLCSILNVKSGGCSEDCAFCAQSAHHPTGVPVFGLVDYDAMAKSAQKAKTGHCRLGLIASGKSGLRHDNFDRLLGNVRRLKRTCEIHTSLGFISLEEAHALKKAGVTTYHHNIETAPSFFKNVVSSHTFEEKLVTIKNVKAAGLRLCSGGILGMGETLKQRVEMAFTLKRLAPVSIPINFLSPIHNTPLGNRKPMEPLEALKAVAMFRLVNPRIDIRICGGRLITLRDFQGLMFFAGASGLMTGDYLTTEGRKPEDDLKMLEKLGLRPA